MARLISIFIFLHFVLKFIGRESLPNTKGNELTSGAALQRNYWWEFAS